MRETVIAFARGSSAAGRRFGFLLATTALGSGGAQAQEAAVQLVQAEAQRDYAIAAQPLADALRQFAEQSGLQLAYASADVGGASSPGVTGTLTADAALARLLSGTGLVWRFSGEDTVVLERAAAGGGGIVLDPVTVEGTADAARFGDTPANSGGIKADYQGSATKSPLPLRQTPQAVSVVTRDSIERRQAADVNTALELSAGVTSGISSSGGPFAGQSPRVAEQFSLRGQRLDGDRDVRIDGFASNSNRNNLDLAPFESIEVVKGPSSMLYGQGSVGGFINLVRKRPQADAAASASAQAGSFDFYRAETDITGPIDAEGTMLGLLTAAYENSGSFTDFVESERVVLAPTLEAFVADRTRALLQVTYQRDNFQPSLGVPLRDTGFELTIPGIPRSFFFGVPASQDSDAHAFHAAGRIDHEVADGWLVSLLVSRNAAGHRGIADAYGYGIDAAGNTYVYSSILQEQDSGWSGELRLDGTFDAFGREHNLLVGLDQNKRLIDTKSGYAALGGANIYANDFINLPIVPAETLPFTFGRDFETKNRAVYAQAMLSVLPGTRVLAGVRQDWVDQEAVDNLNPGAGFVNSDEAMTFRVGLTHDFTDNITAYGTYAQSFNPVDAADRTGNILDPEEGQGYEVGVKTEWLDDRLGATLAIFQQDLDNRPIDDPANGPGEFFSISGGLQRTRGIEVEVSGEPYPGVTVGFASAWLDSEFIDPLDANFGLTPPETADRQTGLYAAYEFQEGALQDFGVGATLVSIGKRWSLVGNTNRFMKGHERVDLHATYAGIEGLDLSLQVRNVLDTTYIERLNGAFAYGHYFGAPRAFLLRGKVDF